MLDYNQGPLLQTPAQELSFSRLFSNSRTYSKHTKMSPLEYLLCCHHQNTKGQQKGLDFDNRKGNGKTWWTSVVFGGWERRRRVWLSLRRKESKK